MAQISVNTNSAATIVLQALNTTSQQADRLRQQLGSGLKVASAEDDGATWAIAQNTRAEIAGWQTVQTSLSRGQSILDIAAEGAGAVSDLLNRLKTYAISLSGETDPSAQASLEDTMKSLVSQVDIAVGSAAFDGNNLIDGNPLSGPIALPETTPGDPTSFSATVGFVAGTIVAPVLDPSLVGFNIGFDGASSYFPPPTTPHLVFSYHRTIADGAVASVTIDPTVTPGVPTFTPDGPFVPPVSILSDPNGGKIGLDQADLTASGLGLDAVDWTNPGQIIATLDTAITITNATAGLLGAQQNSLATALTQAQTQEQALQVGVGNLVDADLSRASAQLQALQTRQQLGFNALSIANAQPASLLDLFRSPSGRGLAIS